VDPDCSDPVLANNKWQNSVFYIFANFVRLFIVVYEFCARQSDADRAFNPRVDCDHFFSFVYLPDNKIRVKLFYFVFLGTK
jgi:hypothetical protein